jgi:hypothetical protein
MSPKKSGPARRGATWAEFCALAVGLPGVERGTSYGTPALHVKKKFLARLREDDESVAIKMGFEDRDVLLQLDPEAFFLTDHYRAYPAILIHLTRVRRDMLPRLIEEAWRVQAPRSLVQRAHETGAADKPRGKPAPGRKARRKG